MAIYLNDKAIAPGKVKQALEGFRDLYTAHNENIDSDDRRLTLKFNDIDHSVDVHGIVRDRGRFYGEHWIVVGYWYTSLDGTATDAYDSLERTVSVFKCEPWEARAINGTDNLVIGVYLTDEGFLGWYYNDSADATEDSFAAEIISTAEDSECYEDLENCSPDYDPD